MTKIKKIGYILYLIFITLILLEIALQVYYYLIAKQPLYERFAVPIYVNDKYRMHAVKPNLNFKHQTKEFDISIYTNSQGFRVSKEREEYTIQKNPLVFRIMLIGPSFAFGWGVDYENSFAAQLDQILAEYNFADQKKIEIINAGVPSLSDFRQLYWFGHIGKDYEPDLVIKFSYGNMIVYNNELYKNYVNNDGYLLNDKKLTSIEKVRKILRYSATVHYLWMAYSEVKASFVSLNSDKNKIIGAGRVLENYTEFDISDSTINESMSYYKEFQIMVEAPGSKFVILHLPLSYCVHTEDITRWEIYGVSNIQKQIYFNEEFCTYLNNQGFSCLNVTPDLIREANINNERLYYYLDLHWTAKGNSIVARSMAEYLLKEYYGK